MNILCNTLKSGGTSYHFMLIKVPDTTSYWKAWVFWTIGSVFHRFKISYENM